MNRSLKRVLSSLFAMAILLSGFAFRMSAAEASGDEWGKEYYKDKFGDVTDEFYLVNSSRFKGIYNNETISNGMLEAEIRVDFDGLYILLYGADKNIIKNPSSLNVPYVIDYKDSSGVYATSGVMYGGDDRIKVDNTGSSSASEVLSGNGEVSFYLEEQDHPGNNYLFKVNCGNFAELYDAEIVTQLKENDYQTAVWLSEAGKTEAAIKIFEALGDYKDSAERIKEIVASKEAETEALYQHALTLLQNEQYEQASAIFLELGTYKDSKAKMAEIEAIRKARIERDNIQTLQHQLDSFVNARDNFLKQIQNSIAGTLGDTSKVRISDRGSVIIGEGVFFDVGSAAIKTAAVPTLNQLIEVFSEFFENPDNVRFVDSIIISGYTDSTGSDDTNRTLSTQRANAVLGYLLENGGGKLQQYASYFCAAGYGESRPLASNDTEEGRAQNRRIEIAILLNEDDVLTVAKSCLETLS